MTYSPLTNKYIPASTSNYSQGRAGKKIVKITPHHCVGNLSIEALGGLWQNPSRRASSNYGIGTDGRIGCYVQEENRSWCSSSAANDNQAITIEVANDGGADTNWHVSDTAVNSLINLMVDICKRYGIKSMNFTGNANGNLTLHKYFTSTACVPIDTEVLTKEGWKKITDVDYGEEIASAHIDDLSINFSPVIGKVPVKAQDTWIVRDIEATADHRMLYRNQNRDDWKCDKFDKIWNLSHQVYIPSAGYYNGKGLPLTNTEIEYLIAVQADGSYMRDSGVESDGYYGIEFHLKKQRKIDSICDLLDEMGYEYKLNKRSDGTISIRIYGKDKVEFAERWLNNKQFTWDWLELSPGQAEFFLDKSLDYDGCRAGKDYSSSKKRNIDIVDAIASLNGIGVRHSDDNRRTHFTKSSRSITIESERKRCPRKQVTCVTVPEGFILVRQNGRTTIIGNCPGPYLESKMPWIADQVNKKLNGDDKPKLTWTKLDKPVDYLCRLQPTNLWDFNHKDYNSCVSVKKFNKGDQITIYGKVYNESLKATYLLTEYSFTNKIPNGFNEYDMELKPDPTPPAPELKWEDTEMTEYITKEGAKLYEVKTGKVVKDYKAGEEIPTVQKATWNNEEYVRTEYSKEKNIDNGFKLSELEKKPEPTPPAPEPEPEWSDIELKKYVAKVNMALYDVRTLEAIKDYKKGEEVEIAQKCTYKDIEWGRTQYSKEKNLNNGFKMEDLEEYNPSPEPDPTIGILQKIIQFIQHIIDLITGKNKEN